MIAAFDCECECSAYHHEQSSREDLRSDENFLSFVLFKNSIGIHSINPLFEETPPLQDKDVEIKSFSFPTLTSPEESELILEEIEEKDSIPSEIDLTLPPTLEVSSSNPTSPTLTGELHH
ncbi:hypothetical protein Tco_0679980 [Tanacetum coccineum]|uniref:Uncharacterized protein n=1 Tax=Tanacetum coccineum TaxID=301880 RepID=A0ABQ4XKN3_9ASTR